MYKIRLDGIGYEVVHPIVGLWLLATEIGHAPVAALRFSMMMALACIGRYVVAMLMAGFVGLACGHAEFAPMMMVWQSIGCQHHHADYQQQIGYEPTPFLHEYKLCGKDTTFIQIVERTSLKTLNLPAQKNTARRSTRERFDEIRK